MGALNGNFFRASRIFILIVLAFLVAVVVTQRPTKNRLLGPRAIDAPNGPPQGKMVTAPVAAQRAADAVEQSWNDATDALKYIQIYKDTVLGSWRVENGALLANRADAATMEIPLVPPTEYDFRIEFSIAAEGGSVGQIMVANGHQFGWYVGAYLNAYCGLQMINGLAMPDNPTGVKAERWLQAGKRHVSLVEVRKGGVKTYLDGKLISQLSTDYQNMSLFDASKLLNKDVPGLWSGDSATTFYSVKIRGLSGKVVPSRAAEQAPADF